MSQDIYREQPVIGYAGQERGIGARQSRSYINPTDEIPFGRGVVKELGVENGIKLPSADTDRFEGIAIAARGENIETKFVVEKDVPVLKIGTIIVDVEQDVTPDDDVYMRYDGKSQVQTIEFDADLITSNLIDLKIDGVSMTQVPFNTSHLQTMNDIAAQILADFSQIASVTVGGTGNRTLTITHAVHGTEFVIADVVVTGGASQAVATVTETVEPVSDDDRGKFRKDADSSTAVKLDNVKFTQDTSEGLVEVDINIV